MAQARESWVQVDDFKRVVEVAVEYHDEAVRCAAAGAFAAACVMIGAAAEAVLLATAMVFERELRKAGRWPEKNGSLETWSLQRLLELARQEAWLPTRAGGGLIDLNEAEVGDAVDFLRWLRNAAVHPGRRVRELGAVNFSETAYRNAYGILRAMFDETHARIQSLP